MRVFSRALAERKAEELQRHGRPGQRVDCSAAAPEGLVAVALARMVCVLDEEAALGAHVHWKLHGDALELEGREIHAPLSELDDGVICSTSGSTGQPKIVVCPRAFIETNRLAVLAQGLGPGRRHITALPTTHCNAAEFSAVGGYFSGTELAFLRYTGPADLLAAAHEFKADHMNVVPTIVADIVGSGLPLTPRHLMSAAAPLSGVLARAFAHAYGPCRLFQGYGLSEASNMTALVPLTDDPEQYAADMLTDSPCVGVILPGQHVALAEDGEILVSGRGVMRCYWPDIDPKRAGVLFSGDLGRFRGDRLHIIGRSREVINRGGAKLSPLEVERHLGLHNAVVVPARDVRMGENVGVVIGNLADVRGAEVMAATERAPLTTRSFKPRRLAMGRWLVSAEYPRAFYRGIEAAMYPLHEYLGLEDLRDEARVAWADRRVIPDPATAAVVTFIVDALREGRDPTRMGALWVRLMCEGQMGVYPVMAAALALPFTPNERVIEFGAGVGNLTMQFDDLLQDVDYLRTDRLGSLLTGRFGCGEQVVDFDLPLPALLHGSFDKALAVNALHCARDPARAVQNVVRALRPGGWLIIGEGEPVAPEWTMSPLFALFEGWNGFYARDQWLEWMRAAGLVELGYGRFVSGDLDLGGVLCGRTRA